MKIITDTTDFYIEAGTAAAIGKFDGVHLGHRKLLEEIQKQKENGLSSCVFTFDPTPAVLFGTSDGRELTTREEKRSLFAQMGVDILIEFPLNRETAAISPEDFVKKILMERMNTRFIAAGSDLSFGNKGAGNAALLQALSAKLGYTVKIIDKIMVEGVTVSSTHIRRLVEKGEMGQVIKMLGMPYTIRGKVVHGNRIGRTLGFPTVNQLPDADKLLPPNGVYFSRIKVGDELYRGITNIGCKPTVTDKSVIGAETFIYDFSREIYEEEVEVSLYEFKRPEMKLAGLEELKARLQQDIADGKVWFE